MQTNAGGWKRGRKNYPRQVEKARKTSQAISEIEGKLEQEGDDLFLRGLRSVVLPQRRGGGGVQCWGLHIGGRGLRTWDRF